MVIRVVGIVKPTRHEKPFLFIYTGLGHDVFVHSSVMKDYGKPIVYNAVVECEAVEIPGKGLRATRIFSATPPDQVPPPKWHAGTVKWFDFADKGYGFVVLDDMRDAFLHTAVLNHSRFSFSGPAAGTRVEVQVDALNTGKLKATAVRYLEIATK